METVFIVIFCAEFMGFDSTRNACCLLLFLQDLGVGSGSYFHFLSYRIFENQLECDHTAFYISLCPVNAMHQLSFQFAWHVWCCCLLNAEEARNYIFSRCEEITCWLIKLVSFVFYQPINLSDETYLPV